MDQPAGSLSNDGESPVRSAHQWYLPWKRAFDFVGACLLLVVLGPVIAVAAALVRLTSRGPAIYRQTRVGLNGMEFPLYKLRSMRVDAEKDSGAVWSSKNDSRVTPIGKLLRSSHIDEFPQLWNVILGHMSLVGPRPERPEFVAKLAWEVTNYTERLKIRPGITGLAQLRLPPDTTIECVRKKVEHDIYYIQHVNPWLDAKLMVFTAWRLVHEILNFAWKAVVLPSGDEIQQDALQLAGATRAVDLNLSRPHLAKHSVADANDTVECADETAEIVRMTNHNLAGTHRTSASTHGPVHSGGDRPAPHTFAAASQGNAPHRDLMSGASEISDEELFELADLPQGACENRHVEAPAAFATDSRVPAPLETDAIDDPRVRELQAKGIAIAVSSY